MLRDTRNPSLARSRSQSPEQQLVDQQEHHEVSRIHTRDDGTSEAVVSTSCRRPRCEWEAQILNTEHINKLTKSNFRGNEEHAHKMNILRLQEQKQREILEQEKLRTKQERIKLKILELQLSKLRN